MKTLHQLRVARQLTQKELALKADIVPMYLLQIERGRRDPSMAVLRRLAHALGVRPRDLLDP
jgi:XRE family transcriptional regulator, regulator of sulfur utilization